MTRQSFSLLLRFNSRTKTRPIVPMRLSHSQIAVAASDTSINGCLLPRYPYLFQGCSLLGWVVSLSSSAVSQLCHQAMDSSWLLHMSCSRVGIGIKANRALSHLAWLRL
jgi:hypothetical protein